MLKLFRKVLKFFKYMFKLFKELLKLFKLVLNLLKLCLVRFSLLHQPIRICFGTIPGVGGNIVIIMLPQSS